MKVHYPKLYNMAHLSLNVFTASKGSNNYILIFDINDFHDFLFHLETCLCFKIPHNTFVFI